MISCKQATELISKQMEEPLTLREEISLKLHLFICEFCEKFRQQVSVIRKALASIKDCEESPAETQEIQAAKERLKKALKENPND